MNEQNDVWNDLFTFDLFHPKPLLIVISSLSGVGKDTVVRAIQEQNENIHFVITATSRLPRQDEKDGIDYIFLSKEEFEKKIQNEEFFEYSIVYDQYKGVPKEQIQKAFDSGRDVIMRLDVQGAAKVRKLCPGAILIFLVPENKEEWYKRLRKRRSESIEDLQIRIRAAHSELEQIHDFDYIVVNAHNQIDDAVKTIMAIIDAEHHRVDHREIRL